MDVDGTLTDGKIYIGPSGEAMKAFNIKDGYGLHDLLLPSGIIPVIITGRNSDIVSFRCKELGITNIYQGVSNKIEKLKNIIDDLSAVAYIGDDLNDLPCIKEIVKEDGIVACPSDAHDTIKQYANYICDKKGGDGCVREFIEWLLNEQQN